VGNPLIDIEKNNVRNIQNRFQGNLSLDYNPVDFIRLHSAFNTDINFFPDRTFNYRYLNDEETFITAGGNQQSQNSNLTVRENRSLNYVWDNTITFDKSFGEHDFTFLLGSVTERSDFTSLQGSRINVPATEDQWYLSLGDPNVQSTNTSSGDRFTRQSFVGRLNYDFADRYLLSAMLRADGSSKFQDRYGYFPTVGVGWVISEENFMKENTFFNFLKFRGSFGLLGNDNIPTGEFTVFGTPNIPYFFNNSLILGTAITQIKDVNLKWESTEQLDIGFEFTILDNHLSGEVDFYNKIVNDALVRVPLPGILGANPQNYLTNLGSFRNRGVEFSLTWNQDINENFRYNVGGNITFNRNKLLNLNQGQDIFFDVTRTTSNQEVGSFFVLDNIGVFQSQGEIDASPVYGSRANIRPGDLKYRDINNDQVIDAEDRVFAGSYQPKYYYGFNAGFTYFNFDFAADFYGNVGNKIYNSKKGARNQLTDNIEASFADDRWRPDNLTNSDPARILSNTPASTYFIESGSFLRLNNLTVGYTLPKTVLEKIKLNNLRIYLTGQNVLTATKYSGFTPELPGTPDRPLSAGQEIGAYPSVRFLSFGVNVGF
jgi:TonB-linked SusC/RagA family outer membrane protein